MLLRRSLVVSFVAVVAVVGLSMGSANASPSKASSTGVERSAQAPGKTKHVQSVDPDKTSGPTKSTSRTPEGCPNSFHHSDTGNGANKSGAYDSTCDGFASLNGNGGGAATGKPCAGCVGNADDKNPKGQAPNGSDSNKGYECDSNNGIGKSNPAHTGCVSSTSTPSTTVAPSPEVVVPETDEPEVLPETVQPAATETPAPTVSPETAVLGNGLEAMTAAESETSSPLAFTGMNVAVFAGIGTLLLAAGLAVLAHRRRMTSSTAGAV